MTEKFTILDTRRIPSAEPNRVGKLDYLVTYQLDAYRTYMVTIPADELTEELIREAVRKDLEAMSRFVGKELNL